MTTQVTKADMDKTAQDCETLGEELASRLQGLMNDLAPLDTQLQGKAGTTFKGVKESISKEVNTINRVLDDIAKAIRTNGVNYEASDAESDASLQQAVGDVDGTSASSQLLSGK